MFTRVISRIIFVLILFTTIVPMVYQQKLLFPFDSEKGLYFRFVVEILFGLWLVLILKEADFRPKKTPINLAIGFLIVVLILVDVLGVDVYLSIFSNFERMAGLILYLTVFGYYFVVSSVINTSRRWVILGVSMAIIAFVVSMKGIIQGGNQEEMLLNYGRVVSTVGNANQLASYLVLSLFIVLLLISEWIVSLRNTQLKLFYTLLFFSAAFIITYISCLLKTSTRGGLIALFLSGLFMLVYLFLKTNRKGIKIFSGTIIIGLFLTIFGLFIFRKTVFIQQNYTLNRITRLTDSNGSNTLQSRLENYKIAIDGIKAKPFFGWGQETFHYTYAQYFNPKLYADAAWYDRVHNIIFEWLIIGGILGLFDYLSLWAAILYQLWLKENNFSTTRKVIISAFLLAYFIINLSLFDNLLSLMIFMTLIAFVNRHSAEKYDDKPVRLSNKIVLGGGFMVVFVVIFLLKVTCIDAYRTNKSIASAYAASSVEEVIDIYEKTYKNALIGRQEVAEQFALMSSFIVNNPIPESTKKLYFENAKSVMQTEINQHQDYARLQIIYGNLLEAKGDKFEALKVFEKVKTLAPKRQSNLLQLSMSYAKNNQFKKALDLLESTYLLDTNNEVVKVNQAIILAMKGDKANRNKIINQLTDKALNENISLIEYAFRLTNDSESFFVICNSRFIGKLDTQLNSYQFWANTAYNLKNIPEVATAVFAFRLHFTDKKSFADQRDPLIIRQDVLNGRNPDFAFQKISE